MDTAEITVTYKRSSDTTTIITDSRNAYLVFKQFFPEGSMCLQERFMVMYMNQSNRLLGVYPMSLGGITGTVADVRLILSVALKILATSLIVAHNHPSGNLRPSQADINLTNRIKEAAAFMEIKLLDHLIITDETYCSLANDGYIVSVRPFP